MKSNKTGQKLLSHLEKKNIPKSKFYFLFLTFYFLPTIEGAIWVISDLVLMLSCLLTNNLDLENLLWKEDSEDHRCTHYRDRGRGGTKQSTPRKRSIKKKISVAILHISTKLFLNWGRGGCGLRR